MRRLHPWICLGLGILLLSGCAAGAPPALPKPTATTDSLAVSTAISTAVVSAAMLATATDVSTATATNEPTADNSPTPKPTRTKSPKPTRTPTETATERPDPPSPDDSGLSRVFERGDSGRREVALTFDAGADRGYAEQILDTLQEYGVVASFGMTGHWAEENPDLVQRMVDEGHMLFNHTYDHKSFTGYSTSEDEAVLSKKARQKELTDTEAIVRDETGYELAPYFRPPYADYDDEVLEQIAEIGYWITLQYSCDTLGWNGATVDEIIERCGGDSAEPGDIILLHVGADSEDADALAGLIESLQAKGFAFVTCEQLLQD